MQCNPQLFSRLVLYCRKYPGVGYSQKSWVGMCGLCPKPLTYLWPDLRFSPSLFVTWPKIQHLIYDHCGWPGCPKHNLWRAFYDGLVDDDEKVASSKKHTQFTNWSENHTHTHTHPIWDQSDQNEYPIYDQKGWKPTPFGVVHTHRARVKECPSPRWFTYKFTKFTVSDDT